MDAWTILILVRDAGASWGAIDVSVLIGVMVWIALNIGVAALLIVKPFHVKQRDGGGFS